MINTGAQLRTFVQDGLLDGQAINATYFYNLANIAKDAVEEDRAWRFLIDEDSSQTVSSGDTYLTAKTLVSDFRSGFGYLWIANADGASAIKYIESAFEKRRQNRDSSRLFYIDLINNQFFITGTSASVDGKTIFMPYVKVSSEITVSSGWKFPSRFHALLGFMIAEMIKGGSDYDQVNILQKIQHTADAKMVFDSLVDWDSTLKMGVMNRSYAGDNEAYDADGIPTGFDDQQVPLGSM